MSDFTALRVAGFPVLPNGVPPTTGQVWWVSNNIALGQDGGYISGSDGNSGKSANQPFATLAAAISASSTLGRGDVIIVGPGHSETITTTLTPRTGTSIIGLGWGRLRPVFQGSGALSILTASAANVTYRNLVFVGNSAGIVAHVALSGADNHFINCEFECRATPLHSIDVVSGAARFLFQDCTWIGGTGCAVDQIFMSDTTTGTGANGRILNCHLSFSGDLDIDEAIIRSDKKSFNGLIVNGLYVNGLVGGDNVFVFDFNSSTSAAADGLICNVELGFDAPVSAADIIDAGGMLFSSVKFTDIVSARGGNIPTTTAS